MFQRVPGLRIAAAVAWAFVAGSIVAGEAPPPPPPPPAPSAESAETTVVTRRDLAASFLRFEKRFFAASLTDAAAADLNRRFDQLTMMFFSGRLAETTRRLDELTLSVDGAQAGAPAALLLSLQVRFEPPVLITGASGGVTIAVRPLYPVPPPKAATLTLRITGPDGGGTVVLERVLADPAAGSTFRWEPAAGDLKPGTYEATIVATEGGLVLDPLARLFVAETSFDAVREKNETALAALALATTPALEQAVAVCRARNALLTDRPSDARSAQFLAAAPALAREVESELVALRAGRNPYAGRMGDYWRVVTLGRQEVPLRLYVPSSRPSYPLIIALHGMGGDENIFMDAYGCGVIKKLADRHGCIVASPFLNALIAVPASFEGLVKAIEQDYPIDGRHIYVIGHSMGTTLAANWARANGPKIAAVCLMAGGGMGGAPASFPPALIIAGALDPLVRSAAPPTSGASRGTLEYKRYEGWGHTLVVGKALPEAVDWLLRFPKE